MFDLKCLKNENVEEVFEVVVVKGCILDNEVEKVKNLRK